MSYVIRRLFYLLIALFGVSFFIYFVMISVSREAVTANAYGEGTSYFTLYLAWIRVIVFGYPEGSYGPRLAVFSYFSRMIPSTLRLLLVSLIVIITISLPLGIFTAIKKNSIFDYLVRLISYFCASIPNFILGMLLIYTFVVGLYWFSLLDDKSLRSMVLPVCALAVPQIARYVRQIRAATVEELSQEYVIGAVARGVQPWRVIISHVLPNILPSTLTHLMVSVGYLLNSIIIIETIFILGGVGSIVVSSIRMRDYLVIQSYIIWMAIFYICSSFLFDIVSHFIDPYSRRKEMYHVRS